MDAAAHRSIPTLSSRVELSSPGEPTAIST